MLGLEKTLRSHLLETMKEKNEFLFFVLRNANDNSFKLLSFADYLTHFKENPEKNELFFQEFDLLASFISSKFLLEFFSLKIN